MPATGGGGATAIPDHCLERRRPTGQEGHPAPQPPAGEAHTSTIRGHPLPRASCLRSTTHHQSLIRAPCSTTRCSCSASSRRVTPPHVDIARCRVRSSCRRGFSAGRCLGRVAPAAQVRPDQKSLASPAVNANVTRNDVRARQRVSELDERHQSGPPASDHGSGRDLNGCRVGRYPRSRPTVLALLLEAAGGPRDRVRMLSTCSRSGYRRSRGPGGRIWPQMRQLGRPLDISRTIGSRVYAREGARRRAANRWAARTARGGALCRAAGDSPGGVASVGGDDSRKRRRYPAGRQRPARAWMI